MASAPTRASNLVVIGIPFPDLHRSRFSPHFASISHFPKLAEADPAALANADIIYGQLHTIKSFDEIRNVKFAQLSNAGADDVLVHSFWKEDERVRKVEMATVAGIHMECISQWFIMSVLAMYHRLQEQILIGQNEKRWATADEVAGARIFIKELKGRTLGVLGYGHIGRECARLAKAFGVKVLAATSSGERKAQEGYIEANTGDPDGSIPEAWYSSRDPTSLSTFLSRCDIVLLALPSTSNTKHVLSSSSLSHLPKHALVLNVGRGDAIDTTALLAALDDGQLGGAALDVTDPEPLPQGHPLFGRKDILLTPHMSGRTEMYFERAVGIFEDNLARWKQGEQVWNRVDYDKGY